MLALAGIDPRWVVDCLTLLGSAGTSYELIMGGAASTALQPPSDDKCDASLFVDEQLVVVLRCFLQEDLIVLLPHSLHKLQAMNGDSVPSRMPSLL